MNILQALGDERLFAPHFAGASWHAWKAFLAALFGLPMSDDQLRRYCHHTGRQTAPAAPFSEATSLLAVFLACFKTYTAHLAPGEKVTVGLIAADRAQARILIRYVTGLLRAVPMLAQMVEARTADTVELSNRVVIEVRTASFRTTRGYSYAAVLCDEVAFWRGDR